MNAAQPNPTTPPSPAPGEVIPPVGKDPSLVLQKELEDNSLYNWLRSVPTKVKSAKLGSPTVLGVVLPGNVLLGVVLLLALAGGIWWWFSGESKKSEAVRWKELNNSSTPGELDKIVKDYPNTTQALIARRNQAEVMFGTEGTAKLGKGDDRAAGIESIEKARAEFVALAEEFKKTGDKTMRAKCLRQAAETEEALIGIPKAGVIAIEWDENQDRGTVAKAIEFYDEAAKAIGEKTTAGERYIALGAQLKAKADRQQSDGMPTPREVGKKLHQMIVATKKEDLPKTPDKPLGGIPIPGGTDPKPPTRPLDPNATIPTGSGNLPKPPDKPLTPTTGK